MYKNVCLGGTFDGIHSGHKLLLGEAVRICQDRLVIGVSQDAMIKKKLLWELIEPYDDRVKNLKAYLESLSSDIHYDIVPLLDIYGPTIHSEDLDCIVVSDETLKGANMINEKRRQKGWHELKIHKVTLIKDTDEQEIMDRLHEKKVSSSIMRVQKLGHIIHPPTLNSNIPRRPYLIGLTGGIASGKSIISRYLESRGLGTISYDLLAHETYKHVGSPVYREIVDFFGTEVLDPSRNIDRRKLGKIVFADKAKLEALNNMVWPAMYELVDKEIDRLKDNHNVIILESALLLESKQSKRVHQVWTTIIPREEAIKRQIESRGLSSEEAGRRVDSQLDNWTRVQSSNVVFCTLWEPEFTQQQVEIALKELEKYL